MQSTRTILTLGYLVSFICGWIFANRGESIDPSLVTRETKSVQSGRNIVPDRSIAVSRLISQRPNWRTDYELSKWLPRWVPEAEVSRWEANRNNKTLQHTLEVEMEMGRDDSFFTTTGWNREDSTFTYAIAKNGFGHRLGNLAFSYLCNIVPNKKQQVVFWATPGNEYNTAWRALFDDSPILIGAPPHWSRQSKFYHVNMYRVRISQQGELTALEGLSEGPDAMHCDYMEYFPLSCGESCRGYDFSRDTWLLRLAQEPSAQEFFMLLRAQLRQHVKDKIAFFIERHFPKDKLVVGVHIRSGNGKDDGEGDFDKKKRGDWLHNLPAAIEMVRKHARMVALSVIDRYNHGLDFEADGHQPEIDDQFRIFLATDSSQVLKEFRRHDPNVLSVPQERMEAGGGVPINKPIRCENMTSNECTNHAEEAMLMDAMVMASCDVALAESFSNWMYTLPATLRFAEGKIVCESGRAQLGVKEREHPHPNTMPIRCYNGAWAARDRSNLWAVEDVAVEK